MPKGKLNRSYTPEFRIMAVQILHSEKLSYKKTARECEISSHNVTVRGKPQSSIIIYGIKDGSCFSLLKRKLQLYHQDQSRQISNASVMESFAQSLNS